MACFKYKIRRGENGKSRFLTFYDLFGYIGPFPPLPNFFGRTNHTNLTRRIDPRHPETPNSPIPPNMAFSFFRFLGFGPEGIHFQSFREGGGLFSGIQGRDPWPCLGNPGCQGRGIFPRRAPRRAHGGLRGGPAADRCGARVANLRRYQEL